MPTDLGKDMQDLFREKGKVETDREKLVRQVHDGRLTAQEILAERNKNDQTSK